ncbi:MAG: hypothetical protein JKY09_06590 [Crocinitomicaceae bacterium]|nr:hypothetical protein [Crocinitomicaceae bacterium]
MNKLDLLLELSYHAIQYDRLLLTEHELEQIGISLGSIDLMHMLILLEIMGIAICQEVDAGVIITLTDHGIQFCESNSFSNPDTGLITLKISA